MASVGFTGPWATDLAGFARSISSMPSRTKSAFDKLANNSSSSITDASSLHIWETDADIDALLQLTQVIVKVRSLTNYVPNKDGPGKTVPAGMIIITEVNHDRDNFTRICELIKNLTKEDGKQHLDCTIMSFETIFVVKGVDNSVLPDSNGSYPEVARKRVDRAVKRINTAVERMIKRCAYSQKKIVWHHGPILHFLNYWINATTSVLRSSLGAITITSLLYISAKGIGPSSLGSKNKLQDIQRFEEYCTRLKISAVFLDTKSQLIERPYLAAYMYYYAYYVNMFLTPSLLRPHLHFAHDALITFFFRLRSACDRNYDSEAVRTVKKQLPAQQAKAWAKTCIDPSSYTKQLCQSAANDNEIATAVHVADIPLLPFSAGPPSSFCRLTVGPNASLLSEHYLCAPVQFDFTTQPIQIRASSGSPFRIWLPRPGQDESKIVQRIQGIMLGALEMVLREKGMPVIDSKGEDALVWQAVLKACAWALDGTKGKLPKGCEEKMEYLKKALGGSWSFNLWGLQT